MRLNHRQLEAFRAMIETGSVTEAANQIAVTQPAASRLLSDLEHNIGFALFVREKKRLMPTPEALALFEEVETSFIGLERISEAAREIGSFRRGALHICGMPALSLGFLPEVVSKFCADRPDISVSLQVHSSQKVVQHIASQQFDLGFAETKTNHKGVVAEPLFEAPMVAILPPDHPLCAQTSLTPEDFAGQNFVSFGSNYPTRTRIDAVFTAANVERRMQIETQLSFAVCQMVAQGVGISVVDPVTAHCFASSLNIQTRAFEPSIIYKYQVLWPSIRVRSKIATVFLDLVKESFFKLENDRSLLGMGSWRP
jgi:DNA-binding transcriptional LysR family regulator